MAQRGGRGVEQVSEDVILRRSVVIQPFPFSDPAEWQLQIMRVTLLQTGGWILLSVTNHHIFLQRGQNNLASR